MKILPMNMEVINLLKVNTWQINGEKFFKRLDYDWKKYPSRSEIIQKIIDNKDYKNYLEVGCDKDENFSKINVILLVW